MTETCYPSQFDLTGRSALITGGAGALGSAAALALASAGAHVTIAGANRSRLEKVRGEIAAAGGSVAMIEKRPVDQHACDAIVARAVETGGGLDILIVASGMAVVRPALEMDLTAWDAVVDANVRQAWLICKSAARVMIEQGRGGKVILISSVRGRFATTAGTSAYGVSKAAVDMLTRSLAVEWGIFGIRVNAIAPTVFRSELTAWLFEDRACTERQNLIARVPLGRLAEPKDHAGTLVFLASAASDFITGQVICVDGGFSAM